MGATETSLGGVPVLAVVGHLTLVNSWEKKGHEEGDEAVQSIVTQRETYSTLVRLSILDAAE